MEKPAISSNGSAGLRMTGLRILLSLGLMSIAVPGLAGTPAQELEQQALSKTRETLVRIDALSRQSSLPDDRLANAFNEIVSASFDVTEMARSSLASGNMRITQGQWSKYRAAYSRHLSLGFVEGVRQHGSIVSKVLGVRTTANGTLAVFARVTSRSSTRDVVWLFCDGLAAKVCEIEVDGVRATVHDRRRFSDYIAAHGIDALSRELERGNFVEIE